MANKITISDIADVCNVSVATVSLVLNNKPGISEETRNRVLQTAQQLGYFPQGPTAVGRKPYALKTVGMVVKTDPDLLPASNPFYSQIIAGVDDACRDMGLNLLFAMLPVDQHNHIRSIPPLLENSAVDGLLMVGTFVDSTIYSLLGQRSLPIVLVDGYSDTARYDSVVSDNYGAAHQAVSHLIKQGHRHIGLIGSEPNAYPSLRERRHGYLRALKDHNIPQPYLADFNINRSQGEAESLQLLSQNPQITAVFCVNDNVALGALRAAQQLQRHVPDDLAIIGYDGTFLATSISPQLSTLYVDTLAMGRAAVHLLALRLEKPDAARATFVIHPELIERETTTAVGQQTS